MEGLQKMVDLRSHRKRVNYSEAMLDALLRDDLEESPPSKKVKVQSAHEKSRKGSKAMTNKRTTVVAIRVEPPPMIKKVKALVDDVSSTADGSDTDEPLASRRGRKEVKLPTNLPRSHFESDEEYKKYQNRVNVQACRDKKRLEQKIMEDKMRSMDAKMSHMDETMQALHTLIAQLSKQPTAEPSPRSSD
jgi:hypothetical protein